MQFDELDDDMKQIILECQDDFIRDGKERFAHLQQQISQWQQSSVTHHDFAQFCLQQAHSMKGVARTIYFNDFHEKCEEIGHWGRSLADDAWTAETASRMVQLVHELEAIFAVCEATVQNR